MLRFVNRSTSACKSRHRKTGETLGERFHPCQIAQFYLSLSKQASQCSNREDVTRGGKAKQCRGKAADSAALGAYMTNGSRFGGARLWNFVFVVPPGVRVRDHMLPRAPSAFYFLPSCCCCCCGIVVCPLHFFVIPPFLHPISERNVRL